MPATLALAWDGITHVCVQDGDQMLYPGIRRSEIITSPQFKYFEQALTGLLDYFFRVHKK